MFRAQLVAAGIVAAALGVAPLASADPVPDMSNDAVLGDPCYNTQRYIFGSDASGQVFACGGPGQPGRWVSVSTLLGVREIGSPCVGEVLDVNPTGSGWTAAQSPEGVPLMCSRPTDTWEVRPVFTE
jgi:hypothetical protein